MKLRTAWPATVALSVLMLQVAEPVGAQEPSVLSRPPVSAIAFGSPHAESLGGIPPASPLALASPLIDFSPTVMEKPDTGTAEAPERPSPHPSVAGLTAERASVLLRSITVPGWGQASVGRTTSAAVFLVAEAGIWASFTAFRIQDGLRRQSYEHTAQLFAGIDLRGRDEEFRRIVGAFISSEEYNRLVVFREAANLFYDDPVRYRQYIAAHELSGRDAWTWADETALLRYRGQRRNSQRAAMRANSALAVAIANRVFSAIHAARVAGRPRPGATGLRSSPSWNLEVLMSDPDDATAFRMGVRAQF